MAQQLNSQARSQLMKPVETNINPVMRYNIYSRLDGRLDNKDNPTTIYDTNLLSLSQEKRDNIIKQYIIYLSKKNYTFSTAKLKLDKMNKFLNTSYKLNPIFFKSADQTRLPDIDSMDLYMEYVTEKYNAIDRTNLSKRDWQIIAIYLSTITGLRIAELLNLRWSHIIQLKNQFIETTLVRKYNSLWQPYYNSKLKQFISFIEPLIKEQDDFLFKFTSQTLTNLTKQFYLKATGKNPPKGFGTHTNRYYLATKNIGKNIGLTRYLLGHKKTSTTLQYMKNQISTREINQAIDEIPFFSSLLKK